MLSRLSTLSLLLLLLLLRPSFSLAETSPVGFTSGLYSYTVQVNTPFNLNLLTLLSSQGSGATLVWGTTGTVPSWLTLNSAAHTLSGTPTAANIGYSGFNLYVQDLETGAGTQMQFTVSGSPVWANSQTINLGVQYQGSAWQFNLNNVVTNPVGGALTFTATNLPSWMTLSSEGILSGTPLAQDVGPYSNIQFTATGSGGSSNARGFGLVIASNSILALSGPLSIAANSCRKYSVLLENSDGSALVTTSPLSVSLGVNPSVAGSVSLYAACGGSPLTAISIASGTSSADFYAVASSAGQFILQGTLFPLSPATLTVQVTAPVSPTLVLTNLDGQSSEVVGACVALSLSAQDSTGVPYIPTAPATVALTSSRSDLVFYSDPQCSNPETSLPFATGAASVPLFASATIAEAKKTMYASATGYIAGSLSLAFVADVASAVTVVPAQSNIAINTCVAASISLIDRFKNATTTAQNISLGLSFTGTSAPAAQFYSDSKCSVSETSLPLAAGQGSAVAYFSSSLPADLTLVATAPSPIAAGQATVTEYAPANFVFVGSTNLNFGNVIVNQTKPMTLTLQNTGGSGTINNITEAGAGFSILSSSTCSNNLALASNATCTLTVQFEPAAVASYSGSIVFATSNGNAVSMLQGAGVTAPNFSFSGVGNLNFGNVLVNSSSSMSLTLKNTGGSGTLTSVQGSGSPFSVLPTSTCQNGLVMATNQTCVLTVQFRPIQAGNAEGSIQWVTASGNLTSTLSGVGILPPVLGFSGSGNLSFGNVLVGNNAEQSVTLTASGSAVTLSSVTESGTGFTVLPSSTCATGLVLQAGASCVLSVQFHPTNVGSFSGSVSVASNGGTVTSNLTGTGVLAGALAFSPASLNFGTPLVGSSQSACVTATNVGQSPLTIETLSMELGLQFVLKSGAGCGPAACAAGMALAPQAQCAFQVQYTATGTAVVSDRVKVDANSLGSDLPYTVGVQGAGSVPPVPPTAVILANGVGGQLVTPVTANVVISWASTNATQCTVVENDFNHQYPVNAAGGLRAGTWSGPNWGGTSNAGVVVAGSSAAMFHIVSYALTCTGPGGSASSVVTVLPWMYAAGGPVQVAYLLGSQAAAQACAANIRSPAAVNADPLCALGRWGTVWVDGTQNPWAVKAGTQYGSKGWCTCFNPDTAPAGKPWAVQNGTP